MNTGTAIIPTIHMGREVSKPISRFMIRQNIYIGLCI